MPVLNQDVTPELYDRILARNLEQQFFYLETLVLIGTSIEGFSGNPRMICNTETLCGLHRTALTFLVHAPGSFRDEPTDIKGSGHVPPDYWQIEALLDECFSYLAAEWNSRSLIHLAAYAFWRLAWIHPFEDGNGRTARAFSYLVLCLKHGALLPGSDFVPTQIAQNKAASAQALRAADAEYAVDGRTDLSTMEHYFAQLLSRQLQSAPRLGQ